MDAALVDRFAANLDSLIAPGRPLGIAVSGGPDSLALLLLAAEARPGAVEAATVDHGLRAESGNEAAAVTAICDALGVPHTILEAKWRAKPETAIQERANLAPRADGRAFSAASGLIRSRNRPPHRWRRVRPWRC